jgi:hypothetical protein
MVLTLFGNLPRLRESVNAHIGLESVIDIDCGAVACSDQRTLP